MLILVFLAVFSSIILRSSALPYSFHNFYTGSYGFGDISGTYSQFPGYGGAFGTFPQYAMANQPQTSVNYYYSNVQPYSYSG